jgi:hypothetical protein
MKTHVNPLPSIIKKYFCKMKEKDMKISFYIVPTSSRGSWIVNPRYINLSEFQFAMKQQFGIHVAQAALECLRKSVHKVDSSQLVHSGVD